MIERANLAFALGVFVGNWLIIPVIFKSSFTKGFAIGVIAALLVLGFYAVT